MITAKDGSRLSENEELKKVFELLTSKASGFTLEVLTYDAPDGKKVMSLHGPIDDVMALVFAAFKSIFDEDKKV